MIRCLLVLTMLLLVGATFAQEHDAESRYRAMEKQFRDAKGLKLAFDVNVDAGKLSEKDQGVLYIAGDSVRLDATRKIGGKTDATITYITDGKQAVSIDSGSKSKPIPVDQHFAQALSQLVMRTGVFLSTFGGSPGFPKDFDIDKSFPVSDFKLGKTETVGDREAQVLECSFGSPANRSFRMSLWLDAKTNLPLKRILTGPGPGGESIITESYTEITLNPTLDSKLFEVPK